MDECHYTSRILTLGERQRVIAHSSISTTNGIKLLDAGAGISPDLYELLSRHKVLVPLDECLSIENVVSVDGLIEHAQALLAEARFGDMTANHGEHRAVLDAFSTLSLHPVLAFKLTVMREQLPSTFLHSLEVAVLACLLARRCPLPGDVSLKAVVAAGLFHDLGLLHIDPDLLWAERCLVGRERQHVYSHPVLSHLIVSRFPEWCPEVSIAVLEHHERLDASGYPKALSQAQISPLGQLLALAELAAALFSHNPPLPFADYVHTILQLNQGKFAADGMQALHKLAMASARGKPVRSDGEAVLYSVILQSLVDLSIHVQGWFAIANAHPKQPLVTLIGQRIERLVKDAASIGMDFQYWAMIDPELAADESALRELSAAAKEGRWQLRAIAQEAQRKWETHRPKDEAPLQAIWAWTTGVLQ
jgi:HD-GYP domain-containing protein (c-di-GMP phosphodiesterase class II)